MSVFVTYYLLDIIYIIVINFTIKPRRRSGLPGAAPTEARK